MSDKVWATLELIVGVALLLSLARMFVPADTARRITRYITRILFGGKKS
jgi:hypothetical protein